MDDRDSYHEELNQYKCVDCELFEIVRIQSDGIIRIKWEEHKMCSSHNDDKVEQQNWYTTQMHIYVDTIRFDKVRCYDVYVIVSLFIMLSNSQVDTNHVS